MTPKILVTVGPNSLNPRVIQKCADIGVFLFRLNLSHTPIENVADNIDKLRAWTSVPICLDSEGAQLRNQEMKKNGVNFKAGDQVTIHFCKTIGDASNISFNPTGIAKKFKVEDEINLDFNGAALRVLKCEKNNCIAKIIKAGHVGSNKAASLNRHITMPAITKKDRMAIDIGLKNGVEHFALSFASSANDVARMRRLCGPDAKIISKIETRKALANLPAILSETDEILIDRGDLSRQLPIEKIPFLQRRIVSMAKAQGVPVYIATNLLESMVTAETPTRAEANDIVSSLLMGADGLVLAAETAIGRYPEKCVEMVSRLSDLTLKWTANSSIEDVMQF
ncbi:MAG: hypothetical protein CBB68_10945 [Rhodospirillaceae bacterium TMED8]|nr:hypothetical protein [Magnetovibrio sp.]OUT49924.1 MAG: hypothetical protein CBB68_10945 [Rhodospirillaceae bacterium TMED8]|tara:strand:- start:2001 stop:3014 length:1014 start_codon:yes stop_codon:yes gene_type:complete